MLRKKTGDAESSLQTDSFKVKQNSAKHESVDLCNARRRFRVTMRLRRRS